MHYTSLMDYLNKAHSPYHAVEALTDILRDAGYCCLQEGQVWELVPGGKYYLTRSQTSLVAFRVPTEKPRGFLMSASHSDRPCFKLKENGELAGAYTRLSVERYGGMLMAPWLDRPLSLAGRVVVETEEGIQSRLVDIDRNLLLIPNVAIHMNRKANEGYAWNPAVDMLPLLGGKDSQGKLMALLESYAGGKILGHDLYLYVRQKPCLWGMDEAYLSGQGLDDLSCVWSCTQGFLKAADSDHVPVLCVFDSEEVGSGSLQGAGSDLLEGVLKRICDSLQQEYYTMIAHSFLVSADNAHGLHPNHPEYADTANAPVLGDGVVIKFNAAQRYTTDGVTAAAFRKICQAADVPVQTYCNRADLPGGSTLGNVLLGHVSVPSLDIGVAQLAMHSCYETVAKKDVDDLERAMEAYYHTQFRQTADGQMDVLVENWQNEQK